MTDDRSTNQELLATHRHRLHVLQLQAAKFGNLNVPPHTAIEITDLQAQIAKLEQQLTAPAPGLGTAKNYREWVVDPMYRGDHTTIGAAIAAATPGLSHCERGQR